MQFCCKRLYLIYSYLLSESRILADFTDFADFGSSVYLTSFVVLRLPIRFFTIHSGAALRENL